MKSVKVVLTTNLQSVAVLTVIRRMTLNVAGALPTKSMGYRGSRIHGLAYNGEHSKTVRVTNK